MEIISVRAQPGCADAAIAFLQQAWGGGNVVPPWLQARAYAHSATRAFQHFQS